MKTYTKVHTNSEAAMKHIMKIKSSGGIVKSSIKDGATILEYSYPDKNYLTVYHGTLPKYVDQIKSNGLEDKTGYNQGWYMVATDFESALFHANPDETGKYVYVFEFAIPISENDKWLGYPYLWKGEVRNSKSTWFALKQKLPAKFIKKVHKIPRNEWFTQKTKGF